MKNLLLIISAIFLIAACKKSETQYIDGENKRQSVNNQKSDTIETVPEISDTIEMGKDNTEVKTDNE